MAYPHGVGRSKKDARNDAAKCALECWEDQQDSDDAVRLPVRQSNRLPEINFVGLVNHYCQVKGLKDPKYPEEKRSGPPHNPQ